MSSKMILPGFSGATSSPGSVAGNSPYNKHGGRRTSRSGPGHALVSRSVRRDSAREPKMTDTYGPNSCDSLPPADLQTSSENKSAGGKLPENYSLRERSSDLSRRISERLKRRTKKLGSSMYKLTWKDSVTSWGAYHSRLAVSVPRMPVNVCIGMLGTWATARNVTTGHCTGNPERAFDKKSRLEDQVFLANWPTCAARDWRDGKSNQHGKNSRPLNEVVVQVAALPTPGAKFNEAKPNPPIMVGRKKTDPQISLADVALYVITGPVRLTATGELLTGSHAEITNGGQLNPDLPRWLMGFPRSHQEAAPNWQEWQELQEKNNSPDTETQS